MALSIAMVTVDCADPQTMAQFWTAALNTTVAADYGEFVLLAPAAGSGVSVGLQRVPEPRTGKNRVHLDLGTADRAAEVDRLTGLGATPLGEHEVPGLSWTVLADPEGNQFCVGSYHT